jgi:hypothetical protein
MAATLHSSGLYRAYKKIRGKEYQKYFPTQSLADKRQLELNAMARLTIVRRFNKNNSIVGISVEHDNRRETALIYLKFRCKGHPLVRANTGNGFDAAWKTMLKEWRLTHKLTTADILDYQEELKLAKRFYMTRVGALETLTVG